MGAEVIKRIDIISRGILCFVERFGTPDENVVRLTAQWIRSFFTQYVQGHGGLRSSAFAFNERRLCRILSAAKVQVQNLEAVDENKQAIPQWRKQLGDEPDAWWSAAKLVAILADPAVLGTGAFGCVWRAQDRHTGKLFAVKNVIVPVRGSFQDMVAQREVELLNRICMDRHPCIVELFFAGHYAETKLYVHVMEFCPGGNLASRIKLARSDGQYCISLATARPWIGQMFLALEYLHLGANVLHRDSSQRTLFSMRRILQNLRTSA